MIEDINITKVERAHTGSWVIGTVDGYKFQALVFAEHAVLPEYELAGSKISKLWLPHDCRVAFNWDRGQDVPAQTPEAQALVDFVCAGLAEHVYG